MNIDETPDDSGPFDEPIADRTWPRIDLWTGALALILGTIFAFAIPVLGGYDEVQHAQRAWQVSDGGVFPRVRLDVTEDATNPEGRPIKGSGGDVPQELVDDMGVILQDGVFKAGDASDAFGHLGDRAPGGPLRFVRFNGAAVYSPVPYLPAAVTIRVARWVGLSTFATLWLARLAQVVAYAALVMLAVRRIPHRKLVLAAFAIAPVALVQAATLNADGITIALVLLAIAQAFRLADLGAAEIRAPQYVEAGLVLCGLGLAKQPYLLVAVFFVLPLWKHRGRVAAILGGLLAGAGALAITWNQWAQSNYVPPNNTVFAGDKIRSFAYVDVDPDAQFTFVREHPFSFLAAIGRTFGHYPGTLTRDLFTQTPEWKAGVLLVVLAAAVLVFALFVDGDGLAGGALTRLLAWGLGAVLLLATFLGGYAGWNAVGAKRIDEYQGRYLMPMLAIIAIAGIPTLRTRLNRVAYTPFVLGGSAVVTLATATGITRHFYL